MAGEWFSKAFGKRKSEGPLEADFRRITDTDLVDRPPQDALNNVVDATKDVLGRRDIMRHLQECLSEPKNGGGWRRIHGGLNLLEHVLRHGAKEVIIEIGEGKHFDPLQRLSFLEKFSYPEDVRVQGVVRKKATKLRAKMVAKLTGDPDDYTSPPSSQPPSPAPTSAVASQAVGPLVGGKNPVPSGKYPGFGADDVAGTSTTSTAASGSKSSSALAGFGSDSIPEHLLKPVAAHTGSQKRVLNGLVAVGHHDDTTSGSDAEEGSSKNPNPGRRRSQKAAEEQKTVNGVVVPKMRSGLEDSTDSDGPSPVVVTKHESKSSEKRQASGVMSAPPPPSVPAPPEVEDLLGFGDVQRDVAPQQPQAPGGPAGVSDLLVF